MAQLKRDHPGKFGVFATLPINEIDTSLAEIEYVFETLKVDGIGLMTNLGERWLGDPHYAPIFEALDRYGLLINVLPKWAAVQAKPHRTVPLSQACNGWIDWYESAEAP